MKKEIYSILNHLLDLMGFESEEPAYHGNEKYRAGLVGFKGPAQLEILIYETFVKLKFRKTIFDNEKVIKLKREEIVELSLDVKEIDRSAKNALASFVGGSLLAGPLGGIAAGSRSNGRDYQDFLNLKIMHMNEVRPLILDDSDTIPKLYLALKEFVK